MQPSRCRILYVDDHEDTAFMLTHLLGQSDYEVETVNSISAALEIIKREKFDLYLLDKRLPDGSGLDLCRKLHEITPEVPIIFIRVMLTSCTAWKASMRARTLTSRSRILTS